MKPQTEKTPLQNFLETKSLKKKINELKKVCLPKRRTEDLRYKHSRSINNVKREALQDQEERKKEGVKVNQRPPNLGKEKRESVNPHPSNFRNHQEPLKDEVHPHMKLVEQRNVDYSYDGSKISFFERMLNLDFINDLPGYEGYIKDCKVQIKVARDLRRALRAMPFRGSVDVPFTKKSSKN